MNVHSDETEFSVEWSDPDPRFLRADLPPPPEPPLLDVLGTQWAAWVARAADAKAAPPDYVLAALLSVAGALIGNCRWAAPWDGWTEPPIIWAMVIGAPSANKSPGLDAILSPLKHVERFLRLEGEAEVADWREKAEIAKLAESTWKEAAKEALKGGKEPPAKPQAAIPGLEPFPLIRARSGLHPRHHPEEGVSAAGSSLRPDYARPPTGAGGQPGCRRRTQWLSLITRQPRGTLLARDELAGWLQSKTRYSNGGSDRPFWLEAYGGRSFTVERMGRPTVQADRLSIGVVGGIQPERLKSLLFKSDDDGLLARFIPIWPNPAPIRRPAAGGDGGFLEQALGRLWTLRMMTDETGATRPWFVPFSEPARGLLDEFRETVRSWESEVDGLLLSFTGKLPGLAVRVSLILAYLDWAADGGGEPQEITLGHFGRAAHLVEAYVLPMARRAYANASVPKAERAARRLVALIREQGWDRFTSRDVLRLDRAGLGTSAELNPALVALQEGDCIRELSLAAGPRGGRPMRLFVLNPALLGRRP